MGFVGNYAPCGLSPQTDGMPVILKNARSLLQNFGRCNAKTADKFLRTCLPFKAVILLYGSSNLSAKQKRAFYIYEYASPNPGVWAAKNPDKIGAFAEYIFFMFLLW